MKRSSKLYGVGLLLLFFGGAGLAENITSSRGSELFCIIFFGIGFGLILMSYVEPDNEQIKSRRLLMRGRKRR